MRVCCLAVIACALGMSCAAGESGTVRGRVMSDPAGVPLRNWGIDLFSISDLEYRQTTVSGPDGSFSFTGVPPGKYRVMDDELVVPYLRHMEAPDRPPLGEEVELSSGQMISDLILKIKTGAIIQGTVVGPDGRPVAGLRVMTLRGVTVDASGRIIRLQGSGSVTLADGGYQLTHLLPGTYSIIADVKRDPFDDGSATQIGWIRTEYPKTVTAGVDEVVSGIDIRMQQGRVYSVRGVVANAGPHYRVFLQKGSDVTTLRMVNVQSDGTFAINGVPPGRYSLDLIGVGPPPILEHTELDLTDQDISDIRLEAKASPRVTARLNAPDGVDTTGVRLYLRPAANPTAPIVFSHRSTDGMYLFDNPSPAPNVISATGLPPGMAIRSVLLNGRAVADFVVDLTNGGAEIAVVIGR